MASVIIDQGPCLRLPLEERLDLSTHTLRLEDSITKRLDRNDSASLTLYILTHDVDNTQHRVMSRESSR